VALLKFGGYDYEWGHGMVQEQSQGQINHVANVSSEMGLPRKVVILGAYLEINLVTGK